MPLLLKSVEPSRGARWVRDAFALYARRPFAFTMMFAAYLFAGMLLVAIYLSASIELGGAFPFGATVLPLALLPLVSVGFMVASQSALFDGPVTPLQFVEPLRGDRSRRRALLLLCLLFGLGVAGILLTFELVSGHAMQRIAALTAGGSATAEQIAAIASEPAVGRAQSFALLLAALLAVPFWHAPALVHWGGQGVGQALFSSTLAAWRCKGAFLVYGLVWIATMTVVGVVGLPLLLMLLVLAGATQAAPLLALAVALPLQTVFYISLLFTFNDSFGGTEARPQRAVSPP